MPAEDDRPPVIPSPVDPDVDCIRVDLQTPSGEIAQPPGPDPPGADAAPRLCPEGYVPVRRKQRDYTLKGKVVVSDTEPKRNPEDPPADRGKD